MNTIGASTIRNAALAVAACVVFAPAGSALGQGVVYDARGFGAPSFVAGPLVGQDGWRSANSPNPQESIAVQSPGVGGQGLVRFDSARLSANGSIMVDRRHDFAVAEPVRLVHLVFDVRYTPGTDPSEVFGFQMQGETGRTRFSSVEIHPLTLALQTREFPFGASPIMRDTGARVVPGQWHRVRATMDFALRQTTHAFDGAPVGQPVAWGPSAVEFGPGTLLGAGTFFVFRAGDDEFQLDNYLVVATAAPCPGDANGDGVISFADVTVELAAFGAAAPVPHFGGDADASGRVTFDDVLATLSNWGVSCR